MLKRVYLASIIISILLFCFGLVLIFNSEGFIKSISTIMGIILLIIGILPVADFFRNRKDIDKTSGIGLISGVFSIVCGLMFILNSSVLTVLIPVLVGVWMIINGVNKFRFSFELKDQNQSVWLVTFIFSIVIIVGGVLLILHPVRGGELVYETLGIIICIYAVLDIIECIFIKTKVKAITTEIVKVIDEQ